MTDLAVSGESVDTAATLLAAPQWLSSVEELALSAIGAHGDARALEAALSKASLPREQLCFARAGYAVMLPVRTHDVLLVTMEPTQQ